MDFPSWYQLHSQKELSYQPITTSKILNFCFYKTQIGTKVSNKCFINLFYTVYQWTNAYKHCFNCHLYKHYKKCTIHITSIQNIQNLNTNILFNNIIDASLSNEISCVYIFLKYYFLTSNIVCEYFISVLLFDHNSVENW